MNQIADVPLDCPDKQLENFMTAVTLSPDDIERRYQVLDDLMEIFEPLGFSKCELRPFGSFLNGLSAPDSDIDVFVDVGIPYSSEWTIIIKFFPWYPLLDSGY
jgi:DNA polymerase sigma